MGRQVQLATKLDFITGGVSSLHKHDVYVLLSCRTLTHRPVGGQHNTAHKPRELHGVAKAAVAGVNDRWGRRGGGVGQQLLKSVAC